MSAAASPFHLQARRTFSVPAVTLYESWASPDLRARWMISGRLEEAAESGIPARSLKFEWSRTPQAVDLHRPSEEIPPTRVDLEFRALGPSTTELVLTHEGFAFEASCADQLQYWNSRLELLADFLSQTETAATA